MNVLQSYIETFGITPPDSVFGPLIPPCEGTGRRSKIIEHIYSNVTIEDHGYETCCYVWQGGSTGDKGRGANYPKMSLDGQSVRVHRVVFMHFEGFLPSKKQVDHKCGTRMCVRFEHLQSVTQKQNCLLRDMKNGVKRRRRRRKARRTVH